MGRRFARNVGFIIVLSALLLAGAGVAGADEWGTNDSNTGAHPDADPHTFCYFSSVTDDMKSGIREAEWDALDPTQAQVSFISSCNLSGSGETDVVWRQGNLSGSDGSTFCEDFDGSNCDQYYVTLDAGNINIGSNDEIDESQTACHELGHTVGLSHGSSDCMISAALSTPPTDVQYRRYSQHHRDHINAWF